jgi:hypothetical protein
MVSGLKSALAKADGKDMPRSSGGNGQSAAPAMRAAPAPDASPPDNSAEAPPMKKRKPYRGTLFTGGSYQQSNGGNTLLG